MFSYDGILKIIIKNIMNIIVMWRIKIYKLRRYNFLCLK